MFCQSLALGLLGNRVVHALKEPYTLVYQSTCYICFNQSIQIPESTIYREALLITKKHYEIYVQGDVFIPRDYYIVHNG